MPPRAPRLWLLLLALACAGGAPQPSAPPDPAAEARGRALAEGWFRQLWGGDALEAYEFTGPRSLRVSFGVARKWVEGEARIFVDVIDPAVHAKVAFLYLQRRERSDDFFRYRPDADPRTRVLRLPAAQLDQPLPLLGIGAAFPLGDLRPVLPGELRHRWLREDEVAGEACDVVESHPAKRDLGFDRLELWLSRKTGAALQSLYFRRDKQVRQVLVLPSDVRRFGDRWLPTRRRVLFLGDPPVTVQLRNVALDPELSDKLFTRQNLHVQRFPAF